MTILKTAEFYKVDARPDTEAFVKSFIKSKNKAANDAVTIVHKAEEFKTPIETDNQKFDDIASEVMANRKNKGAK